MPNASLSERLRSARVRAGFTQHELATKIDGRAQTVSRYERAEMEPRLGALVRIAKACGVSVNWLATGEGAAPSGTAAA